MANRANNQGYDAYGDGLQEFQNPYPKDSQEHKDWREGFLEAAEEDLENWGWEE